MPPILLRRKILMFMILLECALLGLAARVLYLQSFEGEKLQLLAYEQQTRDRLITPDRGAILDRNGVGLALTETVCSVSVINAQVKDKELVAKTLSEMLDLDYAEVLKKVSKRLALERIKTKVDKELADEIRKLELPGVVIDEDIKRVYPYGSLASQVIGFVGKDNQGIIGLEAKYDSYLAGSFGKILTETDARGNNMENGDVVRIPPENGNSLVTSLDVTLQQFAEQTIKKAVEAKQAKRGVIILMNPQNGEIYAMANEPGFDLNDPFTINSEELQAIWDTLSPKEQNDKLNQMWRNFAINDTYEPGSTFKILTSAAGLAEGVVNLTSQFNCHGSVTVGGRQIRCWYSPRSHGSETFLQGVQNSCNPVFMSIAERLGAETFYNYFVNFGCTQKTGIDLPGEAVGIVHKLENVGPVELATMSFGQSFQITPLQLLRAASATINGGYLITPHIGTKVVDESGEIAEEFVYEKGEQVITEEISELMKDILESVVEAGTGKRTYIAGYRVGGKTATSEKLPRRSGKYISSLLAFAPAEDPQVIALVLIDEPKGVYYGGQVAGPVMKEVLENALPYLGVEPEYSEKELELPETRKIEIPDLISLDTATAKKLLKTLKLEYEIQGEGYYVTGQFPLPGEKVNENSVVTLIFDKDE